MKKGKTSVPEKSDKDGPVPWTIRDFPTDVREIAIRKARESKMNISEWVSRAIREKIKNDRQTPKESATNIKKPVDIHSVGQIIDMLERAKNMNIEIPESMQKQTITLIRACIKDVKQKPLNVRQLPNEVRHEPNEIRHIANEVGHESNDV